MGTIGILYSRLTSVTATHLTGNTRLLSPGTQNTDYKGDLQGLGIIPAAGDILRIHAWGSWTKSSGSSSEVQVRLYFNTGNPANLTGPIAATGSNPPTLQGAISNAEWHFFAQITIRSTGTEGTAVCDSYLENVDIPNASYPFSKMAGLAPTSGVFTIDTTSNNYLELTAQLGSTATSSFILIQSSIELLGSP